MYKTTLMSALIIAALTLTACRSVTAAPDTPDYGNMPETYNQVVMQYIIANYTDKEFRRNVIIVSPVPSAMEVSGKTIYGYSGMASLSAKFDGELDRRTFCYFIRNDKVLAFEEKKDADWCE